MTLRRPTADALSIAVMRCVKVVNRNKGAAPRLHPKVDNSHLPTLFALNTEGTTRISTLAELTHSDVSSTSRQVSTLVDLGLVQRVPDPTDGRAHLTELTSDGRSFVESLTHARSQWIRSVLADWSDADGEQLVTLLGRLTTALDQHAITTLPGSVALDQHATTTTESRTASARPGA